MSYLSERSSLTILLGTLAFMLPACVLASNGLYLTGYGNESVFMGGADVAVARDAFAANNNPAGMTQIASQAAELELAAWDFQEGSHTDSLNYRKPYTKNLLGAYGNAAYARRFENSPYAAGVALVVQGGIGWTFSGLNTVFGTRDDASSLFTVVKLAPAFAWEVNDDLSLGVALGINYVAGTQELFPNTSVPGVLPGGQPFTGFRFKEASGLGLNSKWGLQYRPAKNVTLGVTYGTQVSVPMKNGTLRINRSDIGLGVVRYDNAKLTGIRLPEELAVGISFRPMTPLLVSLQEKWYNWSDALNTLQLTASNPRTAGAPPTVSITSAVDLEDQHVIEIGFAYDYDKDTTLMFGINHGSRPVNEQHITPIFQPIPARHYMLGASHKIDKEWQIGGGVEVFTLQSVTYDSPLFGARANERNYSFMFHGSIGRRW